MSFRSVRKFLDDITLVEATQLHLFLSIIILMLFLRFFASGEDLFTTALFSCVSMPVTYTLTYYKYRAYSTGAFVTRKNPEQVRVWAYECVALAMSFVMGYLVFTALSGSTDVAVFTSAFLSSQVMRVGVIAEAKMLKNLGVDIQHPFVVFISSLSVAAVGFAVLSLVLSVLPV